MEILYSQGWSGTKLNANLVAERIKNLIPEINIQFILGDKGSLEVYLINNKQRKLIHSKLNGDGRITYNNI